MLCITSFYFLAEYLHLVGHATKFKLGKNLKGSSHSSQRQVWGQWELSLPWCTQARDFLCKERTEKKITLYLIITLNLIGNNKRFTLQRQTPCADPTFTPSYPTALTTHLHTERITQVPSKNRAEQPQSDGKQVHIRFIFLKLALFLVTSCFPTGL